MFAIMVNPLQLSMADGVSLNCEQSNVTSLLEQAQSDTCQNTQQHCLSVSMSGCHAHSSTASLLSSNVKTLPQVLALSKKTTNDEVVSSHYPDPLKRPPIV